LNGIYARDDWDSGVTALLLYPMAALKFLSTERGLLDNCSCVVLPAAIPGLVVILPRPKVPVITSGHLLLVMP